MGPNKNQSSCEKCRLTDPQKENDENVDDKTTEKIWEDTAELGEIPG